MPPKVAREVFGALERAKPSIIQRLSGYGLVDAEYVVGFVHPHSIWVWLVTASDAQRDRISGKIFFLDEVRAIIGVAGLPHADASVDGTAVQSQETVDRDYGGSWFYALR